MIRIDESMIRFVKEEGGKAKGYWYWANLFSLASLSSFLISINLFLVNLWTLRKHAEKRFSPLGRCLNSTWGHSGQMPEEQTIEKIRKKSTRLLLSHSDKAAKKTFHKFPFRFNEKLILKHFNFDRLSTFSTSYKNYYRIKYWANFLRFFFSLSVIKLKKKDRE